MSFGQRRPGDWMCPTCNFLIWGSKSSCNRCGSVNPAKQFGGNARPGDWMCPNCNFLIWGSKPACRKCGATNPNKSNRANNNFRNYRNDWNCSTCNISNFADRIRCRNCNQNRVSNANDQKQNGSNNNNNTSGQKFKYLVVLDFEATCEENKKIYPQEIIEWPAMIIDTSTNKILNTHTFHFYIKPKHNPKLTNFCTQLTGITQSFINKNGSKNTIQSVLKQWNEWCSKNNLLPHLSNNNPVPNAAIITCGDWDLKIMWSQQEQTSNCGCPLLFHSWINIKHIFRNNMKKFGSGRNEYGMGMMGMLKYLNIQHEGKHHSGIDDVNNICKIVQKLLQNGVNFDYTTFNFNKRNIWNDIRQTNKQIEFKQQALESDTNMCLKKQKFRYLVVLDFEATCDNPQNPNPQEIIEWPAMIIDTLTNKIIENKVFHYYIKPKIHPKLSKFCIQLTGITQDLMDKQGAQNSIESVVEYWNEWCFENNLLSESESQANACIITHFDWDLQKCWTLQKKAAKCGDAVLFHSWIDICVPIYKHLAKFECEANNYGSKRFKRGLKKLLGYLGIQHEGRHHSGIDDVKNICKIVQKCLQKGIVFDYTTKNYAGRHIKNDVVFLKQKQNKNKHNKNDDNDNGN